MRDHAVAGGVALALALVAAACGSSAAPDDAHVPDATTVDADPTPYLSQTGLYADIATKALASDLIDLTPRYPLWSDGAVKRRWLRLPPGTTIDTSDMDHWTLPVGAQLFKEFRAPDLTSKRAQRAARHAKVVRDAKHQG